MAIPGRLIKAGISLNQKLNFDFKSPHDHQVDQLRELLSTAKNTSFGKYYAFKELLKAEDVVKAYKSMVPIVDYHEMNNNWWEQQQKVPDITWPGRPRFFALSSGTTGKASKRIPITDDFLQSMRSVGTSLVRSLPNFDFEKDLFETEILMLSSSANLSEKNGHFEGEISGINVNNFPDWYDWFYRPGKEIASIDNWDERIAQIVKAAPDWNIGALAGIPSWVLIMLQEVMKAHKLKSIHQVWPNLKVYATGGVAFETYRKDFEAICDKPLTIIDTYLASEGFFSYTARPGTMAMELALAHGYFYEFIPFDERGVDSQGNLLDKPLSLSLDEIEVDQEYVLVISTCAGLWRYVIGDVIKFSSTDPFEIQITGRTKFYLNVVGSQLSEEKMDKAIVELSDKNGVEINEYMVAAMKDQEGQYYHQWILVTNGELEENVLTQELDELLKTMNKNYGVARTKALKYIQTRLISKDTYHLYLNQTKKKGGQVKTPKVMSEEKMSELLDLIKSNA
ncbi:MAG: GH3 auxin-responsive promoter family protein [Marinoscillum sp.]